MTKCPEAKWGWMRSDKPAGVVFVKGTLPQSYQRVSMHGGRWVLVSSVPVREYRRVMAATAAGEPVAC